MFRSRSSKYVRVESDVVSADGNKQTLAVRVDEDDEHAHFKVNPALIFPSTLLISFSGFHHFLPLPPLPLSPPILDPSGTAPFHFGERVCTLETNCWFNLKTHRKLRRNQCPTVWLQPCWKPRHNALRHSVQLKPRDSLLLSLTKTSSLSQTQTPTQLSTSSQSQTPCQSSSQTLSLSQSSVAWSRQ